MASGIRPSGNAFHRVVVDQRAKRQGFGGQQLAGQGKSNASVRPSGPGEPSMCCLHQDPTASQPAQFAAGSEEVDATGDGGFSFAFGAGGPPHPIKVPTIKAATAARRFFLVLMPSQLARRPNLTPR